MSCFFLLPALLGFPGRLYWAEPARSADCLPALSPVLLGRYLQAHSRPRLSSDGALTMARELIRSSRTGPIPLYLLVAIARQESSFNPAAVNRASDDYGLFQVHFPFWKRFFEKKTQAGESPLRRKDLLRVGINVAVASRIMAYDLGLSGGDMILMLGRYSGRVGEPFRRYVSGVMYNSLDLARYQRRVGRPCRSADPREKNKVRAVFRS